MQKVVAHFADGTILKGTTGNFLQKKPEFHLRLADSGEVVSVPLAELKGLFFVFTLDGDPENRARGDAERVGLGRKIEVTFKDGEIMVGYTMAYVPGKPVFWITPADPNSNNDRVFVISTATDSVKFID